MQLTFFGAAGEVTGSCHVIEIGGYRILLDCGMIQGGRRQEARNREPFPFDAAAVDAVLLSHAHIDHSGRLPLLVQRGFRGPIHAHNATCDLTEVLLADAAHLARSFARNDNRRRERKGEPPIDPLFEQEDVDLTLQRLRGHRYAEPFTLLPGVEVSFHDAGHIMGSSVVEVVLTEAGKERRLVFSGDLGQYDSPILRDPQSLADAHVLLMESTYGDRNHRQRDDTLVEFADLMQAAAADGGSILVPAFAVGRSQEILFQLGKHYEEWGLDRWQVFVDSPMAIKTSQIYWDYPHLYDPEATRLRRDLEPMPPIDNLHLTRTADQSKAINEVAERAIIIAGSGMLNGGRILHHLRARLENKRTRILFTGYQPPGSLGRRIIDGEDEVRVHGKTLSVGASVHTLGGMSAHADQGDLLRWYKGFKRRPPVYLVHGDRDAAAAFRHKLRNEAGAQGHLTEPGMTLDLASLPD